eukprot:CAMPEP_0172305362 /NCGR_PEP_ID=MMETSP1058-20130122/6675_1 /TAXON_ID=83371 /ORGANISM="Detonula confervacea, Strain CCMP 353" /LENGTH=256 /DNA_ID=CAMNT_0013016943 /DNA_START=54 /DNA_END=820 /DNA_ORIENTATION=+
MNNYINYEAQASTIQIEDITSDKDNASILRRLKRNDPDLTELRLTRVHLASDDGDYCPDSAHELGWFGYYIGKNTTVRELCLRSSVVEGFSTAIEPFCRGLRKNTSIKEIVFVDFAGGEHFQLLGSFFRNNELAVIELELDTCDLGADGCRLLTSAICECKGTLEHVAICNESHHEDIYGGQLANLLVALSMHPHLITLQLSGSIIGRNECKTLATVLRCTTTKLHTLNLDRSNIGNTGMNDVGAAVANSKLLRNL